MTTKRIVYQTPEGLTVVTPNPGNRMPDEDDRAFIARVWARQKEVAKQVMRNGRLVDPHLTDDTPYAVIDVSELPPDRTSRDHWRLEGGKVVVHG